MLPKMLVGDVAIKFIGQIANTNVANFEEIEE
jgi:hypothetical protein